MHPCIDNLGTLHWLTSLTVRHCVRSTCRGAPYPRGAMPLLTQVEQHLLAQSSGHIGTALSAAG